MDSLCKEACPIEGRMLATAIRQVPRCGAAAAASSVSVDPAGDTRGRSRTRCEVGAARGDDLARWARAPAEACVGRLPDHRRPGLGRHRPQTAVYLLDKRGYERAGFLMPFVPGLVADDFRVLGDET